MKTLLQLSNAIIAGLLALLGFASCVRVAPNEYGTLPAPEYGTPAAQFTVRGNVTSAATGRPAPQITVVLRNYAGTDENNQPVFYLADSAATDADGAYKVTAYLAESAQIMQAGFYDTDGDANGAYRDTTVTVVFTDPVFAGGDGRWYKGEATQELDVALTELTPNGQ
jgi:putative lipoprotein (rSAM/lipoprotein system)